jgi:hypothetical protein
MRGVDRFARGDLVSFCDLRVDLDLQIREGGAEHVIEKVPQALRIVARPGGSSSVDEVRRHQIMECAVITSLDDLLVESPHRRLVCHQGLFVRLHFPTPVLRPLGRSEP